MLGEYPAEDDNQMAMLAAMQYYIEYGSEISEEGLTALLKSYIPEPILQVLFCMHLKLYKEIQRC